MIVPRPQLAILCVFCIGMFDMMECSENLALGRPAFQSSNPTGSPAAAAAVDGDTNPDIIAGESCTHTESNGDINPWWAVDLQARHTVTSVILYNSKLSPGYDAWRRLRNIYIGVSDVSPDDTPPALTNFVLCAYYDGPISNGGMELFMCPGRGVTGRYVIVQVEHNDVLSICEAKVFEDYLFQAAIGKRFPGHVIQTDDVKSSVDCAIKCAKATGCSYNAGLKQCELNDASYTEEQSEAVNEDPQWSWHKLYMG